MKAAEHRRVGLVDWTLHINGHGGLVLVCSSCKLEMMPQATQWRCSGCRQTVDRKVILACLAPDAAKAGEL